MCVLAFLSCEITFKAKMIVVTEAWVLCEVGNYVFTIISPVFGLIGVRFRARAKVSSG